MPLNIPNVPWMGDAAQRGVESGTNMWANLIGQAPNMALTPSKMILQQAQAQEAQANAFEKNMFAQLLAQANGQGNYNNFNYPGMQSNNQVFNPAQLSAMENPNNDQQVTMPTKPGERMHIGTVYGSQQNPQQTQQSQQKNMGQLPQNGNQQVIFAGNPNMYGFDAVAGKHPKVPPPHTQVVDGQMIQHWPSGKITSTPVGLPPGEMEATKAMGKYQGEAYGAANDTAMALGEQKVNLERLANDLENYPNPDEVIGPINKHLTQIFGNPKDQELLGEIMSTSGNIVLEAAKGIKGAFTGRDQSLINGMKPTATDPYWVFLGKLKGMGELTDLAQKRAALYSENLHNRMAPHEALKKAQEDTPIESITTKYGHVVEFAHKRSAIDEGKMPSFKSPEEAREFYNTLPSDIKVKLYYRGEK